jgi:Protein of unknown function with PCYCGC motif
LKFSTPTKVLSILIVIPILLVVLAGCSSTASSKQDDLSMASMDGMPGEVKSAPTVVQQAYQFAAANPEVMKQIPCYCGCGAMGHTSNYSCYVDGSDGNGGITYDSHALGCSICVDITQDVMRYIKQGKPVTEIKTYIDQTYSQYGPSNMP